MSRSHRGRDGQILVLSRRGLGRLAAGMLGALGLLGGTALDTDARKKQKKRKRRGKRSSAVGGSAPGGGKTVELDGEERAFLALLNDYRAANGLAPLTVHAKLMEAAAAHSRDMATNNFTGHIGSDGSGPPWRIDRAGYRYVWCGENVFWGDATARVAFDWWKNSPTHDENLLFARFSEVGIRRAHNPGSYYRWYWTTTFGSRGKG